MISVAFAGRAVRCPLVTWTHRPSCLLSFRVCVQRHTRGPCGSWPPRLLLRGHKGEALLLVRNSRVRSVLSAAEKSTDIKSLIIKNTWGCLWPQPAQGPCSLRRLCSNPPVSKRGAAATAQNSWVGLGLRAVHARAQDGAARPPSPSRDGGVWRPDLLAFAMSSQVPRVCS